MKTSLSQISNLPIESTREETLIHRKQVQLLKLLCFVGLFLTIAYLNIKLGVILLSVLFILRVVIFIRELKAIDLNFDLDSDDLMEINEQMWN